MFIIANFHLFLVTLAHTDWTLVGTFDKRMKKSGKVKLTKLIWGSQNTNHKYKYKYNKSPKKEK